MRNLTIKVKEVKCKFCGNQMNRSHREHLANPFCSGCYEERLEASGAIDLRDNHRIIDLGNGYCEIEAIDKTKKFKSTKKTT